MTYTLVLEPQAKEDLQRQIKSGNKILLKKIYRLFEELKEHPQTGTGKPEQLRYEQSGIWSRRIDERHRMLYTIEDERIIVFVISLWGHYDDK
jgi:toxin YoeB